MPGPGDDIAVMRTESDQHDKTGTDPRQWGDPERVEKPDRLDVTISVRFAPAEIATVRARAAKAGLKPTTYIRHCVLATEHAPVDRAQLVKRMEALSRDLDELRKVAG